MNEHCGFKEPFRRKTISLVLLIAAVLFNLGCGEGQTHAPAPPPAPTTALNASGGGNWPLAWSDEFNGAANTPSPANWTYDLGTSGWGNNELETYTSSTQNAVQDGKGNLVITAIQTGPSSYTSARIKTAGLQQFQYGKVEARIKIPSTQGSWPAFWMLGSDIRTVGWPASGEIDIMENIGSEPSINHGTMHGPGYSGGSGLTATYKLPGGARFDSDFHTFSIQWQPNQVMFFVDNRCYASQSPASLPAGTSWVFNQPFFIILNMAVGGNFPGNPDSTSQFPISMYVDYVRVYSLPSGEGCFNNSCASLPGTVQAANYDMGGEGTAYHDTGSINQDGAYRPAEGVDLEPSTDSGGFDVGWTAAGEWLKYTVNVANSTAYTPTVRVASNGQGGAFHIEVDGNNVTGAMTVPNTGGWQSWTTLTGPAVNLTAGQHVMRLVMDSNGATGSVGNFHWLAFN